MARRSTSSLLDPAPYRARGTAFGTTDERHLLNVPAGGMSALPEDPGHFVAWRARHHPGAAAEPDVFAPRAEWARYLDETLDPGVRRRRAARRCDTCGCAPRACAATGRRRS